MGDYCTVRFETLAGHMKENNIRTLVRGESHALSVILLNVEERKIH